MIAATVAGRAGAGRSPSPRLADRDLVIEEMPLVLLVVRLRCLLRIPRSLGPANRQTHGRGLPSTSRLADNLLPTFPEG